MKYGGIAPWSATHKLRNYLSWWNIGWSHCGGGPSLLAAGSSSSYLKQLHTHFLNGLLQNSSTEDTKKCRNKLSRKVFLRLLKVLNWELKKKLLLDLFNLNLFFGILFKDIFYYVVLILNILHKYFPHAGVCYCKVWEGWRSYGRSYLDRILLTPSSTEYTP